MPDQSDPTPGSAARNEPWINGWLLDHVVSALNGDMAAAERALGAVWEGLATTVDEIAGHRLIFAGEGRDEPLTLHEPEHVRAWLSHAICGGDEDD